MITSNMTIAQIVNDHPTTVDVFTAKGLKGLDHDLILQKIGGFSLQSILEKKGMDVASFVTLLNEAIAIQQKDITLYNDLEKHAPIKVVGLLPCPVRIPLMEKLDALEQSQHISFELKAASEGLDWLSERVRSAQSEDDLADMYISAGFDLFFDQGLMKKFKDQKTFADLTQIDFHSDFQNETIALQDPNKDYAMIAVVAAVFLINKKVLGDRPAPQTWSDLFDPIYENSLSLPVSDFDLFNAILLHLYQEFGLEGIRKLKKNMVNALHPAQMVKSAQNSKVTPPAISIMPYFFTKMVVPGGVMEAVWPQDGAILSPIFMLTKASKKAELQDLANTLVSKELGEILAHQGLFPSINQEVDNRLPGKPYKWVGWDFINNHDIGALLKQLMEEFYKED